MVTSYFQRMRPNCRNESLCTTRTQKKIGCFNADGYYGHYNTVFEAMGRFFLLLSCQEAGSALTEEDGQRATEKTEMDEMRKQYIEEKGDTLDKM